MAKFRKLPVIVEAEQFFPDKKPWPGGVTEDKEWNIGWCIQTKTHHLNIVKPGDWIITDEKGEYYLCRPDVFEKTYEEVKE